jgi:hypothetical protein
MEVANFNPDYHVIMKKHLLLAWSSGTPEDVLQRVYHHPTVRKILYKESGRSGGKKAEPVGLRGIVGVMVKAMVGSQVLESMSAAQAVNRLFPGAVFIHRENKWTGRYVSMSLDLTNGEAHLSPLGKKEDLQKKVVPKKSLTAKMDESNCISTHYSLFGDPHAELHRKYSYSHSA